jgi:hypothetical protein
MTFRPRRGRNENQKGILRPSQSRHPDPLGRAKQTGSKSESTKGLRESSSPDTLRSKTRVASTSRKKNPSIPKCPMFSRPFLPTPPLPRSLDETIWPPSHPPNPISATPNKESRKAPGCRLRSETWTRCKTAGKKVAATRKRNAGKAPGSCEKSRPQASHSFSIDPQLGSSQQNPGARVAIRQRVTSNIFVTFSTDVTSTDSQVVQLEYQVNRKTSFSAVRDQNGGFSFETTFRKQW